MMLHHFKKLKTENMLTAKLILYTLFFAMTIFKTTYYKEHIHFGYPPDEIAHFSYITYVHEHHDFIPDYKNMTMYNSPSGNYLSHPPLYYELMNLVYNNHLSIKDNVDNIRRASMLLFLLSFIFILYIGFSSKLSILGDFVFLSLLSSIPMHAYIGASITNDTLAIFGALLFILGLKRLIEKNYSFYTYLLVGTGIYISFFSKLTAAILVFFAGVYFIFYMFYSHKWIQITRMQILLLSIIMLPILYYQLSIFLNYHTLIPDFRVTHPEEYFHSAFYIPEGYRQHLDPYQWFKRMLHYIYEGWFGIHSHHSFFKSHWIQCGGLLILHFFAIVALFFPCEHERYSYCLIGKLTLLALLSVFGVQYIFSYINHLNTGYLGGLQPRYSLPFVFSFAIMASIFIERFKQNFLFTILVIMICIQAIYSDFFYFLQYYN